jgi:hypothetical protein
MQRGIIRVGNIDPASQRDVFASYDISSVEAKE